MTKTTFVRFAALLAVPALLVVGGCKANRVEANSVEATKSCAEGKTCSKAEACCNAKSECKDKAAAAPAAKTN